MLQPIEAFECSQIDLQIICTATTHNITWHGSEAQTPRFHPRTKVHYSSQPVVFYHYTTAGVDILADDMDIPFSIGPIPYHAGPSTVLINEEFDENGYTNNLTSEVKYSLVVTFRGAKNEIIFQSSARIPVFNLYSLPSMLSPITISANKVVKSNSVFFQSSKPIGAINIEARSGRTLFGPGDKVVVSYRGAIENVKQSRIKAAYITLVRCVQVCFDVNNTKSEFGTSKTAQELIERKFETTIWKSDLKVTTDVFEGSAQFLIPADLSPSYETSVDSQGNDCVLWHYVVRYVVTAAGNNVYSDTTAEVNIPVTISGRGLDGFERLSQAEQRHLINQPLAQGFNSRGEIPPDRFSDVPLSKNQPLKKYFTPEP